MLYNIQKLKAVSSLCEKSSVRPALSNVLLTKKKMVATDSYVLLEIPVNEDMQKLKQAFPDLPGRSWYEGEQVIVPKAAIDDVKTIKSPNLPILENVAIMQGEGENTIRLASTTLDLNRETETKVFDGQYPDYERVIPQDGNESFSFDIEKMIQLCQAMKKAGVKHACMKVESATKAVMLLEKKNKQAENEKPMRGLIMPLRP